MKSIILNADEVRAALAGDILTLRRQDHFHDDYSGGVECGTCGDCALSPFGQPGDELWVRETWQVVPTAGCSFGEAMMGIKLTVEYKAGGERKNVEAMPDRRDMARVKRDQARGHCRTSALFDAQAIREFYDGKVEPIEWYGVKRGKDE